MMHQELFTPDCLALQLLRDAAQALCFKVQVASLVLS